MDTIQLSDYGVVINRQNIDAVNAAISKQMQTGHPFVLDFQNIGAIESSSAYQLLEPLRRHYGSAYRRNVHFVNVDPMVDDALVFSGSTQSIPNTVPIRRVSGLKRAFASLFVILLFLTIGVG